MPDPAPLFFDVDGVLIEGWNADPARHRPWDLTLEQDLGLSRAAFQAAFFRSPAPGAPSPMERCVLGQRGLAESLAEVLPALGFHRPPQVLIDYWLAKDSQFDAAVMGVVRRLAARGEVALYVATQQEPLRADHLWRVLGLRRHFRGLFHSAALGLSKKDPAFFHAVGRALSLDPAEPPLLFDDSPAVCAAARAAGWEACQFRGLDDLTGHPRVAPLLVG